MAQKPFSNSQNLWRAMSPGWERGYGVRGALVSSKFKLLGLHISRQYAMQNRKTTVRRASLRIFFAFFAFFARQKSNLINSSHPTGASLRIFFAAPRLCVRLFKKPSTTYERAIHQYTPRRSLRVLRVLRETKIQPHHQFSSDRIGDPPIKRWQISHNHLRCNPGVL